MRRLIRVLLELSGIEMTRCKAKAGFQCSFYQNLVEQKSYRQSLLQSQLLVLLELSGIEIVLRFYHKSGSIFVLLELSGIEILVYTTLHANSVVVLLELSGIEICQTLLPLHQQQCFTRTQWNRNLYVVKPRYNNGLVLLELSGIEMQLFY